MRLDDRLYDFRLVLGRTYAKQDEPTYVSPKSRGDTSRVTECFDRSYDPWDADCPNVRKRVHVKRVPDVPVQRLYRYGRVVGDLLWGSGICLIREERVPAIAAEGFTGLEFHPVELFRNSRCKEPVEGYVEMRAVGRVPVDLEGSGVEIQYACPFCGYTRYSSWKESRGLRFAGEYDDWPEVFMPEHPVVTAIMVKPRFAQLVLDMGLRPFMLVRLEDMRPYRLIYSQWGPGGGALLD